MKSVTYLLDEYSPLPPARFAIIIRGMPNRVIVFAIFAATMLFSTIREWSAPVACPRLPVVRSNSGITGR